MIDGIKYVTKSGMELHFRVENRIGYSGVQVKMYHDEKLIWANGSSKIYPLKKAGDLILTKSVERGASPEDYLVENFGIITKEFYENQLLPHIQKVMEDYRNSYQGKKEEYEYKLREIEFIRSEIRRMNAYEVSTTSEEGYVSTIKPLQDKIEEWEVKLNQEQSELDSWMIRNPVFMKMYQEEKEDRRARLD